MSTCKFALMLAALAACHLAKVAQERARLGAGTQKR